MPDRHNPLPWRAHRDFPEFPVVVDATGRVLFHAVYRPPAAGTTPIAASPHEDAAFAARAANAHGTLLVACEFALSVLLHYPARAVPLPPEMADACVRLMREAVTLAAVTSRGLQLKDLNAIAGTTGRLTRAEMVESVERFNASGLVREEARRLAMLLLPFDFSRPIILHDGATLAPPEPPRPPEDDGDPPAIVPAGPNGG